MAKKETVKSAAKTGDKYVVTIEVNGDVKKYKSEDVFETLKTYAEEDKPSLVKTDLVVKVGNGKKEVEHIVSPQKARRAFANGTALKLLAVNLTRLIG